MNPKLVSYTKALSDGKLPDHKIAHLAKVSIEDVAAARAELSGVPVAAPVVAPVAASEPAAEEVPAVEVAAVVEASVAAPDVAVSDAPPTVRVTANKSVTGPDRRPWFLGFRAVYSGDKAAWLWANHRDVVEVYPKAKV